MKEMKAVRMHSYGGEEVLVYENVPFPEISSDEILVKVHAAGVNPVDWKLRDGLLKELLDVPFPLIPGWDVAGTVTAVGSEVESFSIGDQVFAYVAIPKNGGYAEYVAIKESEAAIMPESLDFVKAASVPLAALTAWQSLFDTAILATGQKVLVHGAAGGVGHFAIQFAKWVGAHVIATASAKNHDFLRNLGVHELIDYSKTVFEEVVQEVDVVFDTIGGDTWERSLTVLKKGGILVSTLHPPPPPEVETNLGIRGAFVFVQPSARELGEIATLIDSNHLMPHVTKVFPLKDAAQAQELSKKGHTRGKLVLQVVV